MDNEVTSRESADQGSAPEVLMGIPRLEDSSLRDEIAEDWAVILGDEGQSAAAIDVAVRAEFVKLP